MNMCDFRQLEKSIGDNGVLRTHSLGASINSSLHFRFTHDQDHANKGTVHVNRTV